MFGLHILLAAGLAAFSGGLSPLGVLMAFVLVYLLLKMSVRLTGLRGYLLRLELGLRFAGWFVVEVVRASLDVARLVLARRVEVSPAVVPVALARADDRVATLIAALVTLTPGTLALAYRSESRTLYVHALDAGSAAEVEEGVRRIEARLLAWLDAGDGLGEAK